MKAYRSTPEAVAETQKALFAAFPLESERHSGKVRDSFGLTCDGQRLRLVYASDRRSIFDMRLGFEIHGIGAVLNAFNLFWRGELDAAGIKHDLVACGREIDRYLARVAPQLCNNPELWRRAIIVQELDMIPVEFVERRFLTGTGWKAYEKCGIVCGQGLPAGYQNGERLPDLLPTPTTKAEGAHDMPLWLSEVTRYHPKGITASGILATLIEERVQGSTHFMWVDGKAEGGYHPDTGEFMWADEIGSPDSCRFWRKADYDKWPKEVPEGFDKELLRAWGREMGIHTLNPSDPDERRLAKTFEATPELEYRTLQRYRHVFMAITGQTVESFLGRIS